MASRRPPIGRLKQGVLVKRSPPPPPCLSSSAMPARPLLRASEKLVRSLTPREAWSQTQAFFSHEPISPMCHTPFPPVHHRHLCSRKCSRLFYCPPSDTFPSSWSACTLEDGCSAEHATRRGTGQCSAALGRPDAELSDARRSNVSRTPRVCTHIGTPTHPSFPTYHPVSWFVG